MPRRFIRRENWEFGGAPPGSEETIEPRSRKRRLASTLVFTTIFFAGASLAAVAGDQLRPLVANDSQELAADTTTTTEAAPTPAEATDASAPAAAPADESTAPDAAAPAEAATAPADATASPADAATTDDALSPEHASGAARAAAPAQPAAQQDTNAPKPAGKAARAWKKTQLRTLLLPKLKPASKPEIEGPADAATIWLNSQLPDPTPPALRLSPKFATNLKAAANGAGLDWATMLGILRARGATGHEPADRTTLRKLAGRLASSGPAKGDWARIVSYSGDTSFADKAAALARYDRAVGLDGLVNGLEAAKRSIASRLLSDSSVSIYAAGRGDIVRNRVDVRVLTVIAYLRESFGQVSVSSLITRPSPVCAARRDLGAHLGARGRHLRLEGTPILGHQEPGGMTERAVRDLLLLPAEVMPRQIISLLGMGGPSFPMADHYNHIHLGF